MNATQARAFLRDAVETDIGRTILRDLHWEMIIHDPEGGDDESSITAATRVRKEMARRCHLQ